MAAIAFAGFFVIVVLLAWLAARWWRAKDALEGLRRELEAESVSAVQARVMTHGHYLPRQVRHEVGAWLIQRQNPAAIYARIGPAEVEALERALGRKGGS